MSDKSKKYHVTVDGYICTGNFAPAEYLGAYTASSPIAACRKTTNKEWLATLSAEEWYQTIHWLYYIYGKRWTESRLAILDWLEEEHTEKKK